MLNLLKRRLWLVTLSLIVSGSCFATVLKIELINKTSYPIKVQSITHWLEHGKREYQENLFSGEWLVKGEKKLSYLNYDRKDSDSDEYIFHDYKDFWYISFVKYVEDKKTHKLTVYRHVSSARKKRCSLESRDLSDLFPSVQIILSDKMYAIDFLSSSSCTGSLLYS
jgi:hypothetical protein